jgi:hypothetical protein
VKIENFMFLPEKERAFLTQLDPILGSAAHDNSWAMRLLDSED